MEYPNTTVNLLFISCDANYGLKECVYMGDFDIDHAGDVTGG